MGASSTAVTLEMPTALQIDCNGSSTTTAILAVHTCTKGMIPFHFMQDLRGAHSVDETKFKSHAEKTFWEACYIVCLRTGDGATASQLWADTAVRDRRLRMVELTRVKAA